jgi:hypothetical protein
MTTRTPRICISVSGHLSGCPRMVKAATALADAGYEVHVVSTSHISRLREYDASLAASQAWTWESVDWGRDVNQLLWLRTGVAHRFAIAATTAVSAERVPVNLAACAYARPHAQLLARLKAIDADLYYGGAGGGIAAAALAARHRGVGYAIDVEDFHSAEMASGALGRNRAALVNRIERDVLPGARFVTAGSAAIADAYRRRHRVPVTAVCNTFPLPPRPPGLAPRSSGPLRLYWFSQTIGGGRGLEDVIRAIGASRLDAELHLRGTSANGYVDGLRLFALSNAPRLKLHIHAPAPPQQMIDLCAGYDVGLAVEPGTSENNALALSNKALTYVLAGLPVVITDTPGHRPLIDTLRRAAIVYQPGDIAELASALTHIATDGGWHSNARADAWQAALSRWHWEHQADRGTLLSSVAAALAC